MLVSIHQISLLTVFHVFLFFSNPDPFLTLRLDAAQVHGVD